jgi:hypothetical protein
MADERVTVTPVLRRNPRGPVFFSPVVDLRASDRDLRLLSFVVPPADPAEVVPDGQGGYALPIDAQCELVLPVDTARALMEALRQQLEALDARSAGA